MSRIVLYSDTFPFAIGPAWTQGPGVDNGLTWISNGVIQGSTAGADNSMIRNLESFSADQWSMVTVNTLTATAGNNFVCVVRGNTTDAAKYVGLLNGDTGGIRYGILVASAAEAWTLLASGGTGGAFSNGDYGILEVEGNALRLYTREGAGQETLRLSITDSTISSGRPGVYLSAPTAANVRASMTAGGNLSNTSPAKRQMGPGKQALNRSLQFYLRKSVPAVSGNTVYSQSLTSSLGFTGSLGKQTSKLLSSSLSFTGLLNKLTQKVLTSSLSFSSLLTGVKTSFVSLTSTLSFSGDLVKVTQKNLTGALTFIGALSRISQKVILSTLSFTGLLFKIPLKLLTGFLSFSSSILTNIVTAEIVTGQLSFNGSLGTLFIPSGSGLLLARGVTVIDGLSYQKSSDSDNSRDYVTDVKYV